MLSVNGRISRDASRDDTTWLRKLELNVEELFNWQILRSWGIAGESHVRLSEKGSRKPNKLENKKKVFLIKG